MFLQDVLNKKNISFDEIVYLLNLTNEKDIEELYKKAREIKAEFTDNKVYYRGLIEYSNICKKNCYYCGIRKDNSAQTRYQMTDEEVIEAAGKAYEYNYGSVVIQSGELSSKKFTDKINYFLKEIKKLSKNKELGITLSVGEQSEEVYKEFYKNGAHRFLLRIETTNKELYYKIHPEDDKHEFEYRMNCLKSLKKLGYQTGTGIMIGLPFQTIEDIANDLLFFKEFDIDMIGMGPYIEHEDTPLYEHKDLLTPKVDRFNLSLRTIAVLRILMKDVNIASATALQAIDPVGREKGLKAGANIIMPNLTPTKYRADYQLYEDKPCIDEEAGKCRNCLENRIKFAGYEIGYGAWGDSEHFKNRNKS